MIVTDQHLQAGMAVRRENNEVFCYHCVTSRAAEASDKTVYNVVLARKNYGRLRQAVKHISQRLEKQLPEGRVKRIIRRVSERLFVPQSGEYKRATGSRSRLPASAIAAAAAAARRRAEARMLAIACVACVVLTIGTIAAYMALGRKNAAESATAAKTDAPPPVAAPSSSSSAAPANAQHKPATPAATKSPAPAIETQAPANLVIPPLLTEREGGKLSTQDFKAQLAQDRLDEAKAFAKNNPADTAGFHRKLADVVKTYANTPAAQEAAKLLPRAVAATVAPPAPEAVPAAKTDTQTPTAAPASLNWFAAWQVENLERRAKARLHNELGGQQFVLETYPPDPAEPLRLSRKLKVPAATPFLTLTLSAPPQGEYDVTLDAAGKRASATVSGTDWRAFAVDLSEQKDREVAVTLRHATRGLEPCTAFWTAPEFVAQAPADATALKWTAIPDAVPAAVAESPAAAAGWEKAVNLLTLVQPQRDAVAGAWALKDGALVSDNSFYARLQLPYRPSAEYDFRVRFTRQDGNDAVALILARGERAFAWIAGGVADTVFGFETISGRPAIANASTIKNPIPLDNNRVHTSLVQVRNSGLKAFLDGRLIAEYPTNYGEVSIYGEWALPLPGTLGVGTFGSVTAFQSIEVLEAGGQGQPFVPETPLANPAAGDPKIAYEALLFDCYSVLAARGAKDATARVAQIKASPLLAPVSAKLDMDAECLGSAGGLREAIAAGAAKLLDKRAFTFIRADGRKFSVGEGTRNVIAGVADNIITVEETQETAKATLKLDLDSLAPVTQHELLRLGLTAPQAELKLTVIKLATFAAGRLPRLDLGALAKDIRAGLETVRKDAALAPRAEQLEGHLAFFEREFDARQRWQTIEQLCKQAKWREARTAMDEFRKEYLNSHALELVRPALDRWSALAAKELASPLLKR
jgi:hypothetical protein